MTMFDMAILVTNPIFDIIFAVFCLNGSDLSILKLAIFSDVYYLFSLYLLYIDETDFKRLLGATVVVSLLSIIDFY